MNKVFTKEEMDDYEVVKQAMRIFKNSKRLKGVQAYAAMLQGKSRRPSRENSNVERMSHLLQQI